MYREQGFQPSHKLQDKIKRIDSTDEKSKIETTSRLLQTTRRPMFKYILKHRLET